MRIAIAFSGDIRTERNWNDIYNFFKSEKHQIDYFLYTTDKVDILIPSFGRAKTISADYTESQNLNVNRVDKFIDCFNPVKLLVEPQKKFISDLKQESTKVKLTESECNIAFHTNWKYVSQMAKAEKLISLIHEYELDNNFEYDIIFRTRPDIKVDSNSHFDEYNMFSEKDRKSPVLFIQEDVIEYEIGYVIHSDWYTYGSSQATKLYYNNLGFNILQLYKNGFDIINKYFDYSWDNWNEYKQENTKNDYAEFKYGLQWFDTKDYVFSKLYNSDRIYKSLTSFEYVTLKTLFGQAEHRWPVSLYKTNLRCENSYVPIKLHRPGFPYPKGILPDDETFHYGHAVDLDFENYEKAVNNGDIVQYDPDMALGYFKVN